MKLFIGWRLFLVSLLLSVPFFSWSITRIVKSNHFDDNCNYHISEALKADGSISSKSLDYSANEMRVVLSYIESNNLTTGYTTISNRQQDEDLGLYYSGLKTKLAYIGGLKSKTPEELERYRLYYEGTHLFLLDSSTLSVSYSAYQHTAYMIWMFIGIALLVVSIIGVVVFVDQR